MDTSIAATAAPATHLPPLSTDTPPEPIPALQTRSHEPPRGTPLAVFADKRATLTPYYKPSWGVMPVVGESTNIAQLLGDTSAILMCFHRTQPQDWVQITAQVERAKNLRMRTLLIVGELVFNEEIGSALFSGKELGALHGFADKRDTVFVMSRELSIALGIQDGRRIRNGLILVQDGRITARSFGKDPTSEHSWGPISLVLNRD